MLLSTAHTPSITDVRKQLKAFLEKVKADTSLQEKLKAADSDAVLAIAKEVGFSISTADLTNAQSKLSEEELEGVAGGVAGEWRTFGRIRC
jgi:predicted ribosomally synthesized peptide with nif11-like leader